MKASGKWLTYWTKDALSHLAMIHNMNMKTMSCLCDSANVNSKNKFKKRKQSVKKKFLIVVEYIKKKAKTSLPLLAQSVYYLHR